MPTFSSWLAGSRPRLVRRAARARAATPSPPSARAASRLWQALLVVTAVIGTGAGCSLIKINGKPLGGAPALAGDAPGSSSQALGDGAPAAAESAAAEARPAPPRAELCKLSSGDDSGTLAQLARSLDEKDPEYAAQALVDARCSREGELASERGKVAELARGWMTRLHLDERDVTALYLYVRGRAGERQDLRELPGPVGEFGRMDGSVYERMGDLDRLGQRASALARVAMVRACFGLGLDTYQPDKHYPLLTTILCTRAHIELARAEQEIDATAELNELSRYYLRRDVWRASEAVRQARAQLAALAKDDAGVRQLLEIADRQHQQWAKPSAQRAKLIAQLEAMEAAEASQRRSAFAGCEDKTVAAWSAQLSGLSLPKVPSKHELTTYVRATMADAEGFLAFSALYLCAEGGAKRSAATRFDVISALLTRRGPITSTVADLAALERPIEFDDRRLTFEGVLGELGMQTEHPVVEASHVGVIARLVEVDGGVEVTFKTVREKRETCMRWQRTNRIQGIDDHGRFIYEERCAQRGTAMFDLTAEPVRFAKGLARGLAPGMLLVAIPGLPIVASRAGSDRPLFVLGGAPR